MKYNVYKKYTEKIKNVKREYTIKKESTDG